MLNHDCVEILPKDVVVHAERIVFDRLNALPLFQRSQEIFFIRLCQKIIECLLFFRNKEGPSFVT